jgi:hypothetical protein
MKTFLNVGCALVLLSSVAAAESISSSGSGASVGANLFQKGRVRATITGGWGQAFNNDYFVLGGGLGYFVLRGLEVGLDGEAWMGEDPDFQKLTPQLRYVFPALGSLYPYVGGFYRRTFYENLDDLDSGGARAGAYAAVGRNMFIGGGVVVERYMDCEQNVYDQCTVTYPEFSFGFVF